MTLFDFRKLIPQLQVVRIMWYNKGEDKILFEGQWQDVYLLGIDNAIVSGINAISEYCYPYAAALVVIHVV